MSSPTIRDVAREAGVGVGTVSRVINSRPSVRERTRRRVEEAIATLQYRPNMIARQLSSGRTSNIAVVAPFFIRPASVERLQGVETVLAEHKYDLVLYNIETQEKRAEIFGRGNRLDGFDGMLVLTLAPEDEEVEQLLAWGLPIVLIDADHPRFNRVLSDDVRGGYLATKHLIDLGHVKIAYISDILESPFRLIGASSRRLEGYRQALTEAGVPYHPAYYRQGLHGVQEARGLTHTLLSLPKPPTAIFAASDSQAIGVLRAAQERGLSVPEDLSVIGFDDIEIADYFNLTTIHQPLFTSGVDGASLLLASISRTSETKDQTTKIELPLSLIQRQTTGPPS